MSQTRVIHEAKPLVAGKIVRCRHCDFKKEHESPPLILAGDRFYEEDGRLVAVETLYRKANERDCEGGTRSGN